MAIQSLYPTIKPSLNLDFAATKQLDPRVTFTRTTTATYYDGKTTAKAEENLLQYSQEFENAYWNKQYSSITANNAVAPDGTSTADTISYGAQFGNVNRTVSLLPNTTYTVSVWARRDSGTNTLYFFGGSPNGSLGTFNPTSTWERYSATFTTVSDPYDNIVIAQDRDASGFTDVQIWGAQLEQRSAVTAYTPTTTQPITNYVPVLLTAAAGQARFDHNPTTGESLGLLIEEQRTNLLQRSEEFDNAYWTKTNSSITANTIIAPDGTLTGDKLVENTSLGRHWVRHPMGFEGGVNLSVALTNSFSVYVKPAEKSSFHITFYQLGNRTVGFNLSTATVSPASSAVSGKITSCGNGWFRCEAWETSAVGSSGSPYASFGLSSDLSAYTGDGYSGIYIWGAQLEVGAFPTSYIKTVAATATRNADAASMTGTNFSSWYRADEGTIYAEAIQLMSDNAYNAVYAISAGSNVNRIMSYMGIDNHFLVQVSSVDQANLDGGITTFNVPSKFGGAYKVNAFALSLNGGSVVVDTSGTIPVVDRLFLGADGNGNVSQAKHIRKIAYYPSRLSNANLQALTA